MCQFFLWILMKLDKKPDFPFQVCFSFSVWIQTRRSTTQVLRSHTYHGPRCPLPFSGSHSSRIRAHKLLKLHEIWGFNCSWIQTDRGKESQQFDSDVFWESRQNPRFFSHSRDYGRNKTSRRWDDRSDPIRSIGSTCGPSFALCATLPIRLQCFWHVREPPPSPPFAGSTHGVVSLAFENFIICQNRSGISAKFRINLMEAEIFTV